MTNGRWSGASFDTPSNVAREFSIPTRLCTSACVVSRGAKPGSSILFTTSSGTVLVGVSNTAGSFMSFQKPVTPIPTKSRF